MFRAVVVLFLAGVLLAALAMISCLSVEDKRRIRRLPRFAWVLVILLVPIAGPVWWFVSGRPRPVAGSRPAWPPLRGALPEPRRPKAPDDDPEFLRSLRQQPRLSRDDEETLRRWEEDLRQRGEDNRGRDPD